MRTVVGAVPYPPANIITTESTEGIYGRISVNSVHSNERSEWVVKNSSGGQGDTPRTTQAGPHIDAPQFNNNPAKVKLSLLIAIEEVEELNSECRDLGINIS